MMRRSAGPPAGSEACYRRLRELQPEMVATEPPAKHGRPGCLHCVDCVGPARCAPALTGQGAYHTQEWMLWPGFCNSPTIYYLLGARKLEYLCAHPPRDVQLWREGCCPQYSDLLRSRLHPPLSVLVPTALTNVRPEELSDVCFAGTILIALPTSSDHSDGGCALPYPLSSAGSGDYALQLASSGSCSGSLTMADASGSGSSASEQGSDSDGSPYYCQDSPLPVALYRKPRDGGRLAGAPLLLPRSHSWSHIAQQTPPLDPQSPPVECPQQHVLFPVCPVPQRPPPPPPAQAGKGLGAAVAGRPAGGLLGRPRRPPPHPPWPLQHLHQEQRQQQEEGEGADAGGLAPVGRRVEVAAEKAALHLPPRHAAYWPAPHDMALPVGGTDAASKPRAGSGAFQPWR